MAEDPAGTRTEAPGGRKAAPAAYQLVADYPPKPTRRQFLTWSGLAWGTYTVSSLVGAGALLRFMYPNVLFEPPQSFKAGKPEDFEWDKPDTRFTQNYGVWMVKLSRDVVENRRAMVVLSTVCTHLGCTPNVLLNEEKIKCPCHGSGFRFTGINFEGPAPRPLERFKISIDPIDGQMVVDKNRKFQHEKGEWAHGDSFIPL